MRGVRAASRDGVLRRGRWVNRVIGRGRRGRETRDGRARRAIGVALTWKCARANRARAGGTGDAREASRGVRDG